MASIPSQSSSSTAPILPHTDPHDVANQHYYYYYPPVHRPPPAHVSHAKRLSETQRTDTTRIQSSVSSAESGSSTGLKSYPSPQTYWHTPSAEQGYVNEKMRSSWAHSSHQPGNRIPSRREMVENNSAVIQYIQEQQRIEDEKERENDHAIWILFWLSCLDPIHSFINAVYSLLVAFTLTLTLPIRICKSQSSFGDQLIRVLAPLFRNHLDMLYAASVEDAYDFEFKPSSLVLINLTAPFMSMGVMLAAWISAAFWLFAITMGNPDGTEKGDDGRDAVLSVRNWWEKYLLNAIKQ